MFAMVSTNEKIMNHSSQFKKNVNLPQTRPEITLRVPPGFGRMVIAIIVSSIIPWLAILASCVGIYFATSTNVWLAETRWTDALKIGADIWALGYGVEIPMRWTAPQSFTLIPLGLSFIYIKNIAYLGRKLLGAHKVTLWYLIPLHIVFTLVLAGLVRGSYPITELVLGATVVSFIAVLVALFKEEKAERKTKQNAKQKIVAGWSTIKDFFLGGYDRGYREDLHNRTLGIDRDARHIEGAKNTWIIPGWVVSGFRLGWQGVKLLGFFTLAVLCLQVLYSATEIIDTTKSLNPGWIGGIFLALLQLLYLPNLQVWALAWFSGAGFSVGSGETLSAYHNFSSSLPKIPVLAVIPEYNWGIYATLVMLALGIGYGYYAYKYYARGDLFYHHASLLIALLFNVVVMAGLALGASGGIGPEKMANWGVEPLRLAALVMLLFSVPMVLIGSLSHPVFRRAFAYAGRGAVSGIAVLGARLSSQGKTVLKEARNLRERNPLAKPENNTEPNSDVDTTVTETKEEYTENSTNSSESVQKTDVGETDEALALEKAPVLAETDSEAVALSEKSLSRAENLVEENFVEESSLKEAKESNPTLDLEDKETKHTTANSDTDSSGNNPVDGSIFKTEVEETVSRSETQAKNGSVLKANRGREMDTVSIRELTSTWAKRQIQHNNMIPNTGGITQVEKESVDTSSQIVKELPKQDLEQGAGEEQLPEHSQSKMTLEQSSASGSSAPLPPKPDPSDPDLPDKPARKSLIKRHRLQAGGHHVDDTSTQALEIQ